MEVDADLAGAYCPLPCQGVFMILVMRFIGGSICFFIFLLIPCKPRKVLESFVTFTATDNPPNPLLVTSEVPKPH